MVFEAVVVDLLNKFLNQYVEDLDTSQLKIGIWGGEVVLQNLKIKTTLFDDFNLPLRVKWGKLGKFSMKIPWKNLYGSQVVVDVDELFVVLVPNSEFKYDPVKEEKWEKEKKQAKLRAIEEAKKRALETDVMKQNDGFLEKLMTQIIKNIQIFIQHIHIRFEDKTTIPGSPFSAGVTLSNLSAQTTAVDPKLSPLLNPDNSNFICKEVNLEGFAVYWNSSSVLFSELPNEDLLRALFESIPRVNFKPENYTYVFGPLSASAFLVLNPKPELDGTDYNIPKVFVNVHLTQIELGITRNQFCDALLFIKDFQRLTTAAKYKKYRPVGVSVIGHEKQWWLFAYNCVAEDIRRRRNEWTWSNIKAHRTMSRKYSELFKMKLQQKKLPHRVMEDLKNLENKLDVFNLVLLREQVYVQVERDQLKKTEVKASGGWFSGWFGSERKPTSNGDEIVKKLESVMTPQEKAKLYKAIGYEESAPPTNYPISFVDTRVWIYLEEIKMTVSDHIGSTIVKLMSASVKALRLEYEERRSASGKQLGIVVGNFQVKGKSELDGTIPELITSSCLKSESLVEILYEKKPLGASCDQRINIKTMPLRIIYHAETINRLREIFESRETRDVSRIVAAKSASLPTFQRMTALGLQYAIEKRSILELKVDIMSSHIIIPYGGVYKPDKEKLVFMLGRLSVVSEENEQKDLSVKKLYLKGTDEKDIFSTVVSASYSNFRCELTGFQILFQMRGEDWVSASKAEGTSPLRFLESTNLVVTIKKSLVTDDARIPKIMIQGNLPSLAFNFSEERFVSLAALLISIPTRTEDPPRFLAHGHRFTSGSIWSLQSLTTQLENTFNLPMDKLSVSVNSADEYEQGISFVGHFEMKEFVLNVTKTKESLSFDKKGKDGKDSKLEEKFLTLRLVKLEVELTNKTFEKVHVLKLGGLEFKQYQKKLVLPFVSTKALKQDYYLFVVEYFILNKRAPDFYTKKGAILNRLTLNITPLNVVLNKDALLADLEFIETIRKRLNRVKTNSQCWRQADAGKPRDTIEEEQHIDKKVITAGKRFRKKQPKKEVIDFFLEASLDEIDINIQFEGEGVCEFCVKNGSFQLSSMKSYTNLDFKLGEVFLLDLNPKTRHSKIISSLEEHTINATVTLYNSEYFGSNQSIDMSVEAEVGGIRCTYVNTFLLRAMAFLGTFQSQVQALKESASVAAQKAKENVMKAYQNAAQICVDIKITAPILLLPRRCDSLETLVIDLGVVTIKNKIVQLDCTKEDITNRPVIDTIKLHLQNLKFYRCKLIDSNTTKFSNEKFFLVPVSFELIIKRNLSTAWYRIIPELEIVARLPGVHVTVTHEDLVLVATIIRDNLSEQDDFAPVKTMLRSEPGDRRARLRQKYHQIQGKWAHEEEAVDEEKSPEYFTVVKFMFVLDSFIVDALLDNKKDEASEDTESIGLAKFVLETLSLKGKMFSDGSIRMSLLLVSCYVDDKRHGKEGRLTRLMERPADLSMVKSETERSFVNSMIEIVYQRKGIDAFDLFLKEETKSAKPMRSSDHLTRASMKPGLEDSERQRTFTVNLRVEKPDILIVENMDSVDTDALLFSTEILLKYRVTGSRQVVGGTLSNIELHTCCFNPVKRPHTMCQVVKPFTISVSGSTPLSKGFHIDICMTEIVVTINPSTVELVSKCYDTLLLDTTTNKGDLVVKDFSNLWDISSFSNDDYWYMKPEQGLDAMMARWSSSISLLGESYIIEEICLLAIPCFTVTVEGLAVKHTKPFLLLEMGFQLQCQNWSTKMSVNASIKLKLSYFNKLVSAWEPLIEPVQVDPYRVVEKPKYDPWELTVTVSFDDEGDLEFLQPPKMCIDIIGSDVLEMTLTKTCVEVLKDAVDTYTSAVTKGITGKVLDKAPYIVKNETGLSVELLLDQSRLQVCKSSGDQYEIVKLETNSEVELQEIDNRDLELNKKFPSFKKEAELHVNLPNALKSSVEIPLGFTSKRYYPISMEGSKEVWGLVSDVSVSDNTTTIILQSILRVHNYFLEPIHIHAFAEGKKEAVYVGTVEGSSTFGLPFNVVYGPKKKLFFSVNGYSLSLENFLWETIKTKNYVSVRLQCNSKTPEDKDPFFIQAVGEVEQIYFTNTNRRTVASVCYLIHLEPTVKIMNALSVDLIICCQGSAKERYLQPGNFMKITNAEPGGSTITLRISNYLEKEWSCKATIVENPPEFLVWKFISYNGLEPETINLGVHCTQTRETAIYTIYCPYFMVNKTGILLSYKFEGSPSVFYHPGDHLAPVMFSPIYKKFFGKKSAYLQVELSEWSEKFPVDVAGSGGTVECENIWSNVTCKISVTISLTYNSLTRVVVFTPFYVFTNEADFDIECQECNVPNDAKLNIPANSCIPFWPTSHAKAKTIRVRPKDSKQFSSPFGYDSTDSCLLKFSHECGGIFVDIQVTQSGTYISFRAYEEGQAPALILNHSGKVMELLEEGTDHTITLQPLEKVIFTWACPTGDRKLALRNPHSDERTQIFSLDQDTEGSLRTDKDDSVRYATFLDGAQRVLLFTEDVSLSSSISLLTKNRSGTQVICKLQGIGISLVNNASQVELLYIGIISSGIVWEAKKPKKTRFKHLSTTQMQDIETAYSRFENDNKLKTNVNPVVEVTEKLKVDFETMEMIEPIRREMKRTCEPGLWVAYRVIEDKIMFHFKINKLQIDNQLHDCIFPIILSPVSPPKTIASINSSPKPFFEVSIVKVIGRSGFEQYKYFQILVQEFHVKIDIGIVRQLWLFLAAEEMSDEDHKIRFRKDLEFTQRALVSYVEVYSSSEQKNFYDLLHFSPLKIHFSFSVAGNIDRSSLPPAFSVMLQSLGVTLTDVHDVIFRLSYFERRGVFLSNTQVQNEVYSHYYGQIIKQAYVLVLGLDVIGNPYGLIVGIGEGVEAFFYEPVQGIIKGPSDFATGVAIGCKSLFGHTVGSTAGTLGKLTETLGKGLAVLSLDKEYQIQRMENLNRHDNIQTSMARSGRGLVMGVYEGVAGVVKRPLEGAKQEGAGGFFKGLGKGMLGLVTRPVTGIVDFASTSLNAVRRAAESGSEQMRLRPPRFFRLDSLVDPYNLHDAQGNELFYTSFKRKFAATDRYEFHMYLKDRDILILTNKRMILAQMSEIFGTCQEHMVIRWSSMPEHPKRHTKGIAIAIPQKSAAAKKEKVHVKVLIIPDPEECKVVCKKMNELYNLEKEGTS